MKQKMPSPQEELQRLAPDLSKEAIKAIMATDLDLSEPAKKRKAIAILTEAELRFYENGEELGREPLTEFSHFTYHNGVGCVSVICQKSNGEAMLLARATAKRRRAVSDFVRQANRSVRHAALGTKEQEKAPLGKKTGKKQGLLRLFKMARSEWKLLALTVLLFFVTTGIGLVIPYLNRLLIDDYIQADDSKAVFISGFVGVILAILIANLLRRLIAMLRGYILAIAGNRFIVRLRDTVFHKIQELSISGISRQTSGELMKRVNGDTARIKEFIINQLPSIVEQALLLLAVAILLFTIQWQLALLILLPAPLISLSFRLFWRLMRRLSVRIRDLNARGNAVLHDVFSGIRVVKAYGMEEREEDRFVAMAANERDAHWRQEKIWAILVPILNFIMGLSEYILLYYLGSQILQGNSQISVGMISQVSAYAGMIYAPLALLIRAPRMFMHMMTSVSAIFDLLDEPNEVADHPNAAEITELKGNIEFDHVSFGYDNADEVLHEISLSIREGEFIGLVGKSGVGKSTLINLIMRMYDVDDGSIRIDGHDIRDIPQHTLRAQMGVVLQENFLFAGTVWQNLAYAKPNATRDEIIQAAKLAGAHEFILRLPDAYQTYVGERGHTLSGGERQRIAIARALLHDPKILILDEATSALDTETEKLIQDALLELTKGRTTVAIAHRLSTLRHATRLVVMDEGRIAEEGTHEELMARGGIYYGLVMAQREMSQMNVKEDA